MKELEGCQNSICCHNDKFIKLQQERDELKKENSELKQMVNSPSITFTTCPKCDYHYELNYCREVHDLRTQLSNKEAIIKEVKEHVINAGVNTLMGGHKDKLLAILDKGNTHE